MKNSLINNYPLNLSVIGKM